MVKMNKKMTLKLWTCYKNSDIIYSKLYTIIQNNHHALCIKGKNCDKVHKRETMKGDCDSYV